MSVRRPRVGPDRQRELLDAALAVLCEQGYDGMTMDQVATRGRCSKATLYRQWASKPDLVAAAIRAKGGATPVVDDVDTGSLVEDLRLLVERSTPHAAQDAALVAAVHHAMLVDAGLAQVIRETMLGPLTATFEAAVDRAVARGELPTRPAVTELAAQLLLAAALGHPVFVDPVDGPAYVSRVLENVVLPILRG